MAVVSEIFPLERGRHRVSLIRSGHTSASVLLVLLGDPAQCDARYGANVKSEMLQQVGDECFLEAREPVELLVSILGPSRETIAGTEVGIEALQDNLRESEQTDLCVVAHVERLGDVRAAAGSWIAGPVGPARIEGLMLQWPGCPADLIVSYRVALANGSRTDWRQPGQFAGSRGQAMPIISIALAISGASVDAWQFDVQAAFRGKSGSITTQHSAGPVVTLAGPTDREHLVGVCIALRGPEASSGVNSSAKPLNITETIEKTTSGETSGTPAFTAQAQGERSGPVVMSRLKRIKSYN